MLKRDVESAVKGGHDPGFGQCHILGMVVN